MTKDRQKKYKKNVGFIDKLAPLVAFKQSI